MRAVPLRVSIAASPLLAVALVLSHGGAIACAVAFLAGWWIPALVAAAIASSLVFHIRRDALQLSGDAITALSLKEEGQCELTLLNGSTLTGNIDGSTYVTALLTIINVRPVGRRPRAVVLMPDSAPAHDLRRIRVWLRYRVQPKKSASGAL